MKSKALLTNRPTDGRTHPRIKMHTEGGLLLCCDFYPSRRHFYRTVRDARMHQKRKFLISWRLTIFTFMDENTLNVHIFWYIIVPYCMMIVGAPSMKLNSATIKYHLIAMRGPANCLWGPPNIIWGPPSYLWGPPSCLWNHLLPIL